MVQKALTFTWEGAAERFRRLAQANLRATEEWLRQLSVEESIRIFEDLCQGAPERSPSPVPTAPPIALFRIWRP